MQKLTDTILDDLQAMLHRAWQRAWDDFISRGHVIIDQRINEFREAMELLNRPITPK